MLSPEQVVPFLQHDDPAVRNHARRYFRDTYDFGPLTADHYWAVIDRFGENDSTLGFAADLSHVPQTDSSLQRLLRALAAASETFNFHYQHAARDMDLAVVARHRENLFACPQLLPHVREHLELRQALSEQSPDAAWNRLMEHGRDLAQKHYGQFAEGLSGALIEAAARGGAEVCEQALAMLGDESARMDWREIFAVRVLGAARYEPAVDALVQTLAIDADVLREVVNRALARIGTPRVIERIVDFYPGKPWHVRLYANSPLAPIKRPQSEEALLKLLDIELAVDAAPLQEEEGDSLVGKLLRELTDLGSLAGLNESRRLIAQSPEDPEVADLCEYLLAAAVMNGVTLPEETDWRKLLKARESRIAERVDKFDGLFREIRERWRKTGASFAPSDATLDDEDRDEPDDWDTGPEFVASGSYPALSDSAPPTAPIRNTAPKVGRNDPCPCRSGKKYKKCCGK